MSRLMVHMLTLISRTGKQFNGVLCNLQPSPPLKLQPYRWTEMCVFYYYFFLVLHSQGLKIIAISKQAHRVMH